jgi:hypothetical protein
MVQSGWLVGLQLAGQSRMTGGAAGPAKQTTMYLAKDTKTKCYLKNLERDFAAGVLFYRLEMQYAVSHVGILDPAL